MGEQLTQGQWTLKPEPQEPHSQVPSPSPPTFPRCRDLTLLRTSGDPGIRPTPHHLSGSRLWAPTVSMSLRLSISCLLSLISLDATQVLIWSLSRWRWEQQDTQDPGAEAPAPSSPCSPRPQDTGVQTPSPLT